MIKMKRELNHKNEKKRKNWRKKKKKAENECENVVWENGGIAEDRPSTEAGTTETRQWLWWCWKWQGGNERETKRKTREKKAMKEQVIATKRNRKEKKNEKT